MRHLQLAKNIRILTWLQQVTFEYTFLCLFDDIRDFIHDLLPKVTLVNEIYNPVNIHKCIIVPRYAIGAYFSTLHQALDLDKTNQQQNNRIWRQQSSFSILYTNKYIVKYFEFVQTINELTLTALGKRQFYDAEK